MEHLPDEIAKQMAAEVINRASRHPDGTITALSGLVTILDARFGPDHQATLNALSCQANISHDLGDQERRVESIRRVLASHDRQGRAEDALTTACGLALAQGDAGDMTGAADVRAGADPGGPHRPPGTVQSATT